jgi:hypothetical protein
MGPEISRVGYEIKLAAGTVAESPKERRK